MKITLYPWKKIIKTTFFFLHHVPCSLLYSICCQLYIDGCCSPVELIFLYWKILSKIDWSVLCWFLYAFCWFSLHSSAIWLYSRLWCVAVEYLHLYIKYICILQLLFSMSSECFHSHIGHVPVQFICLCRGILIC